MEKSLSRMVVGMLFLGIGCEKQPPKAPSQAASVEEGADPDIVPLSGLVLEQENTVAITEELFLEVMARRRFSTSPNALRSAAVEFAALANDARALGLSGWRENGVTLGGKRVVVMHNPRKLEGAQFQVTSYSVVNGQLDATVDWALVNVKLHLSGAPQLDCTRRHRGCIPLLAEDMRPHAFSTWTSDGLGLPPSVRVDAESPGLPVNHVERSIQLWNLPNTDVAELLWPLPQDEVYGYIGNRFVCAEPIENRVATECDAMAATLDEPLGPGLTFTPIPGSVGLVSEADFEAQRLDGQFDNRNFKPSYVALAVELVTALNHSSTRGVRATRTSSGGLDVDTLIVAKTPRVSAERVIEAERYFVVPGPIAVRGEILGVDVNVASFGNAMFSMGVCGPVMFPQLEYPRGDKYPPGSFNANQGGYGSDRQHSGRPRTTMRWPVNIEGLRHVEVVACSLFEPPRPPPREGNTVVFRQEYCNGIDDNANGKIDEGSCFLNACSECDPIDDCGPRRCVTIPDGCESVLSCPCP